MQPTNTASGVEAPEDGPEIILLTVCRLAGEKGFEFLAHATRVLAATGLRFRLYVVGGNRSKQVEAEVHAMFDAELVASRKVIFAGFRTSEALAAAYASADVFLHCSVTETFGLVVLEAMASGVPVVARDEGGPSDIVVDSASGFLTPPNDMDAFVQKVVLLARDKALRGRMSVESRRLACEATWEKIGNTVAWRMAECIEERELQQQTDGAKRSRTAAALATLNPIYGWMSLGELVRTIIRERIVDARLVGGLGVILGCWGAVSVYLVFIKMALWIRSTGPAALR